MTDDDRAFLDAIAKRELPKGWRFPWLITEAERDRLVALAQRGAAEAGTWQPMETAPQDREILLWWPYWSQRATIGYWKHDRWSAENALTWSEATPGPKGWMPLPAPPPASAPETLRG